jgi:hypothetical protein
MTNRRRLGIIITVVAFVAAYFAFFRASPGNEYAKAHPDADFFVWDEVVCLGGVDWAVDWWGDNTAQDLTPLGEIRRSGKPLFWQDGDASQLPVGTPVYAVGDRGDVLVVEVSGAFEPYVRLVEG